jgi:hypothetical protein
MNRIVGGQRARVAALVAALACALTASFAVASTAAWAVGAGRAEVVNGDTGSPMNSGGSATFFGLNLPGGARCPGDTAHQGYHVFTYLLPKDFNLASATYTNLPLQGIGLIASGEYIGALNTDPLTAAVRQLPGNFTFARLKPSDLFGPGQSSATWEAGVSCADRYGRTARYWNVEMVFTLSHSDPGGFVWRLSHHESAPSSTRRSLIVVAAGVAGAVVAYKVVNLCRRKARARRAAVGAAQ